MQTFNEKEWERRCCEIREINVGIAPGIGWAGSLSVETAAVYASSDYLRERERERGEGRSRASPRRSRSEHPF